jgi:hypothetical protein
MQPLVFAPYGESLDVPNVVVDGSPNRATVLTLSHWPGTHCPPELLADTSAEMAFLYVDEGMGRHGDATIATNNHFDEDGVVAMLALTDPSAALADRDFLVDVARAGDFGVYRDRRAARVAMVITAFANRLDTASAYRQILPIVAHLETDLDEHRDLWLEEDAHLTATERDLDQGRITIDENPDLDLAVVRVRQPGRGEIAPPHEMAIHNRTDCFRIATLQGTRFELRYRYETWIRYQTRRPPPRVDLRGLAERLTVLDADGIEWHADSVEDLTPALAPVDGHSSALDPDVFLDEVRAWLTSAETTWSPYE